MSRLTPPTVGKVTEQCFNFVTPENDASIEVISKEESRMVPLRQSPARIPSQVVFVEALNNAARVVLIYHARFGEED